MTTVIVDFLTFKTFGLNNIIQIEGYTHFQRATISYPDNYCNSLASMTTRKSVFPVFQVVKETQKAFYRLLPYFNFRLAHKSSFSAFGKGVWAYNRKQLPPESFSAGVDEQSLVRERARH